VVPRIEVGDAKHAVSTRRSERRYDMRSVDARKLASTPEAVATRRTQHAAAEVSIGVSRNNRVSRTTVIIAESRCCSEPERSAMHDGGKLASVSLPVSLLRPFDDGQVGMPRRGRVNDKSAIASAAGSRSRPLSGLVVTAWLRPRALSCPGQRPTHSVTVTSTRVG